MVRLALHFLGAPRIELDGAVISLSHNKAVAFLAYLSLTRQPHTRQTLAALFWPDFDPTTARREIRRMIWVLNKNLGQDWLEADHQTVQLLPQPDLWLDVDRFRELVAASTKHSHPADEVCPACLDPLTEAVALARGDFLAGFSLADSPDFDDWQTFETESLRRELAGALERLVQLLSRQRDALGEQAISYARRWLALDRLHEPAHRHLMQLYAWSGQPAAALRQYQSCVQVLKEELGILPAAETTALYEAIKANRLSPPIGLEQTQVEASSISLLSPDPVIPPHNLPLQVTPFIGREAVLDDLQQRLSHPEVRLMTIIGPGGIGKTRLALALAERQLQPSSAFRDGVYVISLAPISDSKFIVPTIADAIGYTFYDSTDPQVQLLTYLQEKRLLLILDNLEHLLAGVHLLVDLHQQAPAIKLLTTSRERLNLQAEWVFELQGLPVPPNDETSLLEGYSAAQLFLQSAQRAQAGFAVSPAERSAVGRICRLMEGLPLGLELAGAWVRLLSCSEIAQEIERNLDFLTVSARDLPTRHHSIRAVFDYSWALLPAEEQRVLRQLSVFRGDFQREAAAQVAGASLRELAGLVDKSLVSRTVAGRYHLHELLRQFSAEKLEAVPAELATTRAQHSDYFLGFLRQREPGLSGKAEKTVLDEIQAEIENVRAAWNWAVEQEQVEALDRALDSLYHFYWRRSHYQEGEETFRRVAEHLQQAPELGSPKPKETALGRLYMKALARQGAFCITLGRYDFAKVLLQNSLDLARRWAVQAEMAFCLNFLATVLLEQQEDYLAAEQLYQESLRISQTDGDRLAMADTLERLGQLSTGKGDFLKGKSYLQQSLDLLRETENQSGMAYVLDALGLTTFDLGESQAAEQYYRESLALFKEIGDRLGIALAIGGLGLVAWSRGETGLSEARQLYEESLVICREIGHQSHVQTRLVTLGHISNSLGSYEAAQTYFQAARNLTQQLGKKAEGSWIVTGLGAAALGLGDFQAARRYLLETLQSPRTPIALEALVSWATLLKQEADRPGDGDVHPEVDGAASSTSPGTYEQKQQAVEILSLILNHPAAIQIYKDRAAQLLAEFEAELSPEVMAAARERGQTKTVAEVVRKIVEQSRG